MALLIRQAHRSALAHLLDRSFALRRRVFVEQLGWRLPGDNGRIEADAFDQGEALHLVSLDDGGRVVGTARLTPTLLPNVTCDILQARIDHPLPRGHDIVESARVCVDQTLERSLQLQARNDLFISHFELCLRHGWTRTLRVSSQSSIDPFVRAGFAVDILGSPVRFDDDPQLSFANVIATDPDHIDMMMTLAGAASGRLLDPDQNPELLGRFGQAAAA